MSEQKDEAPFSFSEGAVMTFDKPEVRYPLVIHGNDNEWIIRICRDGSVETSGSVSYNEAARMLWASIYNLAPDAALVVLEERGYDVSALRSQRPT